MGRSQATQLGILSNPLPAVQNVGTDPTKVKLVRQSCSVSYKLLVASGYIFNHVTLC